MAARFWIGGSGSWNDTAHWSTTTGGTGGASVPVAGDTATFDSLSGTGTCTTTSGATCASITLNTSTLGFTLGAAMTITGNCTVTLGTFSLGTFTFTCGSFGSNNTNTRTIDFGTGNITLSGSSGAIWTTATVTGLTISGTPVVNVSYSGATACTVSPGAIPEASAISFNFTAGTYSLAFLTNTNYSAKNIDFTGFKGTWSSIGPCAIYGNLKLDPGMLVGPATNTIAFLGTGGTYTITSNGTTLDCPITFNGIGSTWRMTDNLTVGATRTTTLTNGTLDINGFVFSTGFFSSTSSNTRALAFGVGSITLSGAGGTLWNMPSATGFTATGNRVVNIPYSGATATTLTVSGVSESNALDFNFTAGTYTLTFLQSNAYTARSVNFTGFSGTWSPGGAVTLYGSLTLSGTMTLPASTFSVTFGSTTGSKTITSNGKVIDFPLVFNGLGGTWVLQDELTMGATRTLTHTNGTLDLGGKTLTVGTAYTTAAGTKNLTFNGGSLVCPGTTTTAFNNASPATFTTTQGTGTGSISMTGATAKTFVGGGSNFACALKQNGAGALTVSGSNTFLDITATYTPSTVTLTSSTTTTVSAFTLSGTAGNLVTLNSSVAGTRATLTKSSGSVLASYLSIKDNSATGGASWVAQLSTDAGNNLGWTIYTGTAPLSVSVTGVNGSALVGTVTASIPTIVSVGGTVAFGYVGDSAVSASAVATLSSVTATAYVGTVTAAASSSFDAVGVAATTAVGDVTASGGVTEVLGSLAAYGYAGSADVSISTSVSVSSVIGTGSLGTLYYQFAYSVTGVEAIGSTGVANAKATTGAYVTGLQATGYLASVLVWGKVNTDQTPNWTPVDDHQGGVWRPVIWTG